MSATDTSPDVVRIPIDRELVRGLLVALAGGVVLALTGAFNTGEATLVQRLAYWLPVMLMGGLWGHACSRFVDRWIDGDRRPWLQVVVLTAVISGPLSVAVWAVTGFYFGDGLHPLSHLPYMILPVATVTATISAVNVFTGRKPVQTQAAAVGARPARFLDRLPPKLRGAELKAVESEDHYLRVHTDRGSDLILMRLSDALGELEGLEGAQTHRSWWVARNAVRDVRRGDGRATLTLDGGVEAPVSRRYAKALRESGWY